MALRKKVYKTRREYGFYRLGLPEQYTLVKKSTRIGDFDKYAKKKNFRFVKDSNLFGGYYVDKKGNAYLVDTMPTHFRPLNKKKAKPKKAKASKKKKPKSKMKNWTFTMSRDLKEHKIKLRARNKKDAMKKLKQKHSKYYKNWAIIRIEKRIPIYI